MAQKVVPSRHGIGHIHDSNRSLGLKQAEARTEPESGEHVATVDQHGFQDSHFPPTVECVTRGYPQDYRRQPLHQQCPYYISPPGIGEPTSALLCQAEASLVCSHKSFGMVRPSQQMAAVEVQGERTTVFSEQVQRQNSVLIIMPFGRAFGHEQEPRDRRLDDETPDIPQARIMQNPPR